MTLTYSSRQPAPDVTLPSGAVLDVQPPRDGVVFDVRKGTLWITQTGDPVDHVLTAGESFRASGNGLLVVQALEPSVLSAQEDVEA